MTDLSCDIVNYPYDCDSNNHNLFDDIAKKELAENVTVESVMISCGYMISIAIDIVERYPDFLLSVNEYLKGLKGRMGVYALWKHENRCADHEMNKMLCLYVGKGKVQDRVKSHIKIKLNKEDMLYISFYDCENRMAKYIEQLFLDKYDFELNSEENIGTEELWCDWSDERVEMGTQIFEQSELLAKKLNISE
jgi:hypothetical protein